MSRIFSTVVRRVTTIIAGGSASTTVPHSIGLRLTTRLTALVATVTPGIRVAQGPSSLSITQKPALRLTARVDSSQVVTTQKPALRLTNIISKDPTIQKPAVNLTQIVYSLTRRVGADASADVTGTWTNRANAQGIHDGSDATSTGAVSGATRKVRLDYANNVGKTDLTITSVKLYLYIQSAGNAGGLLGSITAAYNIGAGEVIPTGWNARTDTFDFTTTPAEVDITSAIGGDWAKLDALQTFVSHVYAAVSATFVCSVDAIEVEVLATATQAL